MLWPVHCVIARPESRMRTTALGQLRAMPAGSRVWAKAEALYERRNFAAREGLVRRVAAEFREMPDLRLSTAQAGRLFDLRTDVCARLIDRLVREGVLRRDGEGRYATV